MTQEKKELLLKDLCARLPYHTKCYCEWSKEASNGTSGCVQELSTFLIDELEIMGEPECDCQISGIKPYLRPMSSMTEDEREEWENTFDSVQDYVPEADDYDDSWHDEPGVESYDWLNKKGFDYRGLIPMGLAFPAPEDMYK